MLRRLAWWLVLFGVCTALGCVGPGLEPPSRGSSGNALPPPDGQGTGGSFGNSSDSRMDAGVIQGGEGPSSPVVDDDAGIDDGGATR